MVAIKRIFKKEREKAAIKVLEKERRDRGRDTRMYYCLSFIATGKLLSNIKEWIQFVEMKKKRKVMNLRELIRGRME